MPPITSRTLLRALTRPAQCETRRLRATSSLAALALARCRTPGAPSEGPAADGAAADRARPAVADGSGG